MDFQRPENAFPKFRKNRINKAENPTQITRIPFQTKTIDKETEI